MKQDQSYFRQVFYLKEDNLVWVVQKNIALKIAYKIVALFTKNYPSFLIEQFLCRKQAVVLNLGKSQPSWFLNGFGRIFSGPLFQCYLPLQNCSMTDGKNSLKYVYSFYAIFRPDITFLKSFILSVFIYPMFSFLIRSSYGAASCSVLQ